MRILLVEDEPDAARMLAKGLREEAYVVDVAGCGEENDAASISGVNRIFLQPDHNNNLY